MRTEVDPVGELTRSPDWPPRWMTVAEVAAELERFGFWQRPPFRGYTARRRLDYLAAALAAGGGQGAWARLGARFKPASLLTEEDHALLRAWQDERHAAFDEELSCILLGEPLPRRDPAPGASFKDFLRQGRPLVEQLAELAHRLEWNAAARQQADAGRQMPPRVRRIRKLVTTLTDLFDLSPDVRAAA